MCILVFVKTAPPGLNGMVSFTLQDIPCAPDHIGASRAPSAFPSPYLSAMIYEAAMHDIPRCEASVCRGACRPGDDRDVRPLFCTLTLVNAATVPAFPCMGSSARRRPVTSARRRWRACQPTQQLSLSQGILRLLVQARYSGTHKGWTLGRLSGSQCPVVLVSRPLGAGAPSRISSCKRRSCGHR
jgi:hypothetical protein